MDNETTAKEMAYEVLIFFMAERMKAAAILSGEDISQLEAEATLAVKGAEFSAGAPEQFQVKTVEDTLAQLPNGLAIIRRAASKTT
ncbi:hypothetical protein [Bradyrhizobium sp.]|uniref:hypothetical protein n=1 Tax=Bradyrhizobium sp. TaxID=376 RepID=UPI0027368BC0|nr:hypothetical protein [Bradyrhizobium sp.]MDP3078665.1 hypothetical protein [Bradyrhizobium sp.]